MPSLRELILRVVSPATAARMEADSRSWRIRCPDGHERSMWEAGGIRWKAAGSPRKLIYCPDCKRWRWHRVYRADRATPG
jgi:hypothetical protein